MVRKITQETFNEAIRDNIDLLGISFEEALNETIKQFEAQNVDLSNISKEIGSTAVDETNIMNSIKQLKQCNNKEVTDIDIFQCLNTLKTECDKGLAYKIVAGKNGAYGELIKSLINNKGNKDFEKEALKTILVLMTKQPDLLDDRGVEIIISHLKINEDVELVKLCLKWAKECCFMHEMNKQKLYDAGIVTEMKPFLDGGNSDVLADILALFRSLILDDDIRVEFGKAHEHARGIASETLPTLINLMSKYKSNENIIKDLILTVSNLLVRNEFCKEFSEVGGLELVREVMIEHAQNGKILQQCFKLLKALAGNDDSKSQVISRGLGPLIIETLKKNIKTAAVMSSGLACIAALTLRSPENSKVLFENDLPNVIIQIMRTYPKEKSIQKSGSWAIRNMVSRSKYQCGHFLELGAEEILKEAFKNFKDCVYDIKAALRDLGCEVEFKEEWTGKGGFLN